MTQQMTDGWKSGRRVAIGLVVLSIAFLAQTTSAWAQNVTLDLTGSGTGTVVSSPAGINCAGGAQTCTGTFAPSTAVTLTATASTGHTFGGWSGACTGTGACAITTPASGGLLVAASFHGTAAYVFYHQDAIGSVRAITSESGAVIARHDYEPFGEDTQALTGDPIRFGGKELDAETAMNYFGARYYRNTMGRFTTVDPVLPIELALVDPQRWNRYAYVMNRPLTFTDPDGRCPACIVVAAVPIVTRYGPAVYNALTRMLNSPLAQEAFVAAAEVATGSQAPSGIPDVGDAARAYRHTFSDRIERIKTEGLRLIDGKIYATPTEGLSPLAAQIELALPGNRFRDVVLKINLEALRKDGYKIPEPTRVSGQFGRPGGGWEYVFDYDIPEKYLIWD